MLSMFMKKFNIFLLKENQGHHVPKLCNTVSMILESVKWLKSLIKLQNNNSLFIALNFTKMFGIPKQSFLNLVIKMEHLRKYPNCNALMFFQTIMLKGMLGITDSSHPMTLKVWYLYLETLKLSLQSWKNSSVKVLVGQLYGFQTHTIGLAMNIIFFLYGFSL